MQPIRFPLPPLPTSQREKETHTCQVHMHKCTHARHTDTHTSRHIHRERGKKKDISLTHTQIHMPDIQTEIYITADTHTDICIHTDADVLPFVYQKPETLTGINKAAVWIFTNRGSFLFPWDSDKDGFCSSSKELWVWRSSAVSFFPQTRGFKGTKWGWGVWQWPLNL